MNPRIIDQGDSRWANLGYRTLPYNVRGEGCGLCAVTMCAMELSKYWNYTPLDTIDFMRTYATNGNGTEWAGIDAGLDKYLGNHTRHYNMASFWDEVSKGDRVGVILFGSNTAPDGTIWSKGGHYVCFVDYKYEDGQHWLYTKDSSYRHNDGWHSYERSMRGCIPNILWTAEVIDVKNGWYKEAGYWYFYRNGKIIKNDWAQDSKGLWYYLTSDGKMATSKILTIGKSKYYVDSKGARASGWVKFKEGWRYFSTTSGKMFICEWKRDKGADYYFNSNGIMATGKTTAKCDFGTDGKLKVYK